ncbi:MAG: SAM-dependent methyltransferase [Alphaproteobacteria bacterium 16-39-46]|nr:MAG: SAM-dependent methyltransferase [Alphaproteobacteria bacterium 16-39-46]OZA43401.1 MAG: SAM-dependent methyltransferase [Alphaproteobacteria bacterium 17-39-52]HQS83890.1 class I SAM-dependent methyltransferase [Alphaproteobacteria bacterium]HQS93721.1 class I SAM-dependent methyltransferase [Alphaproteobacteria bacterium]
MNYAFRKEDYIRAVPKEFEFKEKGIIDVPNELYQYMLDVTLKEPKLMRELRLETQRNSQLVMQSSPDQGQFMSLLVKLMGAKKILEIGTFTGYSTLWMASALPQDGKIIACDVSEEWTSLGQKYWKLAKVDHKIDLRIAPAEETLEKLIKSGCSETFDIVFIDADKSNQSLYFEYAIKLLRSGGLVIIDNVLWAGKVINSDYDDIDTEGVRKLNERLKNDKRVDISMLALGDGVTLARKI